MKIMRTRFDNWPHIISAKQFSREWIENEFLPLTDEMQVLFNNKGCEVLRGKRMVLLFYQPSTRTKMSFEMAMDYLGGKVVFSSENAGEFSSAKKGETLRDTFRVINRYRPDVVVIRYDKEIGYDKQKGAEFAATVSLVPIINAGDRAPEKVDDIGDAGQHPTQALLDLRTIFKRRGIIDGLKIAMVGDLKNGRTVRSLSYLLGKFKNVEIDFVSPDSTKMAAGVKEYLTRHHVKFRELTDLREVASNVDAVYQTRTQTECGASLDRSDRSIGYFIVDKTILDLMKKEAIIMHPLPRVDEITPDVDDDPRAVYLTEQIDSGLLTRMALLKMILAPKA
jgi:aspartate carbamoyltransferase catalytic subunit